MALHPQTTKSKKKAGIRPYNRYNIFFILERERLVLSKGGSTKWSAPTTAIQGSESKILWGYNNLQLPSLPSRFAHLRVPKGWCAPSNGPKKRPHRRTHGVATFRELAQSIAASWKTIDADTLEFCSAVEKVLKERYLKLTKAKGGHPSKSSTTKNANTKPAKRTQVPAVALGTAPTITNASILTLYAETRAEKEAVDTSSDVTSETNTDNDIDNTMYASPAVIKEIFGDFRKGTPPLFLSGREFFWTKNKDTGMFGEVRITQTVDADDAGTFASLVANVEQTQDRKYPSLSAVSQHQQPYTVGLAKAENDHNPVVAGTNWATVYNHFGILQPTTATNNSNAHVALPNTSGNNTNTNIHVPTAISNNNAAAVLCRSRSQ